MADQPLLSEIEVQGSTWNKLREHIEGKIAANYAKTGKIGVSERDADAARGAIAELKKLLGAAQGSRPESKNLTPGIAGPQVDQ